MQERSLCSQSKVVGGGREGGPLDSEAQPVVTCYGKIQIIKKFFFWEIKYNHYQYIYNYINVHATCYCVPIPSSLFQAFRWWGAR